MSIKSLPLATACSCMRLRAIIKPSEGTKSTAVTCFRLESSSYFSKDEKQLVMTSSILFCHFRIQHDRKYLGTKIYGLSVFSRELRLTGVDLWRSEVVAPD